MTGNACVGWLDSEKPGRRVPARMDGVNMTPHTKWAIGGVIVGLILLGFIPWWFAVLVIAAAVAIPAAAYLMLDESQRRRLRENLRRRGQLGS
jgi:hypothetical protein